MDTSRDFNDSSFLEKLKAGFRDRYEEGREDYRQAYYGARELQGLDPEDARIKTTLATNPTFVTARDLIADTFPKAPERFKSEKIYRGQRDERGMALHSDRAVRGGQVLGTIANDLTQDNSRTLWWLLNAPQATGNVLNELALSKAAPELFAHEDTRVEVPVMVDGKPKRYDSDEYTKRNLDVHAKAVSAGLISQEGVKRKGIGQKDGKFTRRKYAPGDVASLAIPTGIAINAGIGLLNPLGGSGGYTAVLPSQDDMTRTSNVVGEVGAKYILGKTGNLLPYEEFSKYRPDVDIGEYNRYKAFKYDKDIDVNPFDDGQVTLPVGVAKFTMEGIHGPEAQFLGRSLPVTTTLVPYLGALLGGVAGVTNESPDKYGKKRRRPIKRGLIGGMAGLAVGSTTGLIAEELRRRASSNQVQTEGGNAEQYLQ